MQVGTVAAGRIGSAVLRRLKPFDVGLHYTDRHRLPEDVERGARTSPSTTTRRVAGGSVRRGDDQRAASPRDGEPVRRRSCSSKMKRGAYLINTARGKICDRDAVVRACESGQLAGYAGDVWFPQPPPSDHPWRSMPHHGMTPHISGTSLSAQARYAAGTREILECWFDGPPDPRGVPDRRRRQARRRGRALLQRGRRDRRLGGGRALQRGVTWRTSPSPAERRARRGRPLCRADRG